MSQPALTPCSIFARSSSSKRYREWNSDAEFKKAEAYTERTLDQGARAESG